MTYVGTLKNRGAQTDHQVSQATEFCTLATNICESAVLNWYNVALLSPTVLENFWTPVEYGSSKLLPNIINMASYPQRLESSPSLL
jgi:hypothetical protein